MAQPLGTRLRVTGHSGLTSPNHARTPDASPAGAQAHSQDPRMP